MITPEPRIRDQKVAVERNFPKSYNGEHEKRREGFMATLKEVAGLAGVSLGTVSNVLNGKTQNEELISRVEKAMKQLAYRPDATARSLKSTRTNTVGVILPDIMQKFNGDFMMELERLLRERGYSVSVKFSRNNRLIERKSIESFLDMRVDGMILYSGRSPGGRNGDRSKSPSCWSAAMMRWILPGIISCWITVRPSGN